jgi:hypothetical protein
MMVGTERACGGKEGVDVYAGDKDFTVSQPATFVETMLHTKSVTVPEHVKEVSDVTVCCDK